MPTDKLLLEQQRGLFPRVRDKRGRRIWMPLSGRHDVARFCPISDSAFGGKWLICKCISDDGRTCAMTCYKCTNVDDVLDCQHVEICAPGQLSCETTIRKRGEQIIHISKLMLQTQFNHSFYSNSILPWPIYNINARDASKPKPVQIAPFTTQWIFGRHQSATMSRMGNQSAPAAATTISAILTRTAFHT